MATKSVGLFEAARAPITWLGQVLRDRILRGCFLKGLALSIVATVVVFGGVIWGAFALVDYVVPEGGTWATILATALKIVSVVLVLFVSPVLFTMASGIVGSAFLGGAHARARELAGGPPYPARSAGAEAVVTARSVGWELRRLARFLVWTVVIGLAGLIPVVGIASIVAAALLAAHTLAWEILSPHFEALGLGYTEQKRYLFRRPGLTLGLGGVATLLLLIPFAQPLVLYGNQSAGGALSARLGPS